MRLLGKCFPINVSLAAKDYFMSVKDSYFVLFCSHIIVRFNHLKKSYNTSCVYSFVPCNVIVQTLQNFITLWQKKKRTFMTLRVSGVKNLIAEPAFCCASLQWWKRTRVSLCHSFSDWGFRKTWHVNGGEKVKTWYVRIIYFSLINQNYIL